MNRILPLAILACAIGAAQASEPMPPPRPAPSCTAGEKWTGNDKTLHLAAGATIAFATTLGTEKPLWGFAAGSAVGLLKELSDRGGNGCPSGKDFGVTVLGAAIGAFAGNQVLVMRKNGTTIVAYQKEF